MFHRTRQERLVLIFLAAALLVGAAVRVWRGRAVPPPAKPVELAWDLAAPKPSVAGLPGATAATAAPKVDVNRATAAELATLPGIGDELARRIVAYREAHGPFRRPADLGAVAGIGPETVKKIAPLVTTGAEAPKNAAP